MLIKKARDAIAETDFLLICAGAGFSADSGLPVYNDIANVSVYNSMGLEYQDLCDPIWLNEDPHIFYGFWGDCFNLYRNTKPHDGYNILYKWKNILRNKVIYKNKINTSNIYSNNISKLKDIPVIEPVFIYTSNVDGHFHKLFNKNEIYEIHGNIETWQCGNILSPCNMSTIQAPTDFKFNINKDKMEALKFRDELFLTCKQCGSYNRPNILMFHDTHWIPNQHDEERYVEWESAMENIINSDSDKKLVILEIGCGLRVPSVRKECEMVIRDIINGQEKKKDQITFIRINIEDQYPVDECNNILDDKYIYIQGKGINVLKEIDKML